MEPGTSAGNYFGVTEKRVSRVQLTGGDGVETIGLKCTVGVK